MGSPKRADQDPPVFKHRRLDASNPTEIRLLRVLPDLSSSGRIQCEIFHADIGTKFACLPYVWGDPTPQKTISIIDEDGLESDFVIRKNLWDFLCVARSKFSDPSRSKVDAQLEVDFDKESEADMIARLEAAHVAGFDQNRTLCSSYQVKNQNYRLWIDAMCIDQTVVSKDNETPEYQQILSERNQQVQMMGKIYDGRTVLAWLGSDKEIESFMVAFRQSWELVYVREAKAIGLRKSYTEQASESIHSLKSLGGRNFSRNEYWDRAWITQELTLAGRVILLSGLQELGVWRIKQVYSQYNEDSSGGGGYEWQPLENHCWEYLTTSLEREKESLIRTLHTYRNKKCSVVNDRIFSLLALCEDGKNVVVDYGKPTPQLLVDIFRSCSPSLCFCAVATVAKALNMEKDISNLMVTSRNWLCGYGIQIQLFSVWPGSRDRYPPCRQAELSRSIRGRIELSHDMTINPRMCPQCFRPIPKRFSQYKGRILCLKSVCRILNHLYWEYAEDVVETPGEIRTGKFYVGTDSWGGFTSFNKPFSIRMTAKDNFPNREFILQFTFATIVEIWRDLLHEREQDVCERVDREKPQKKSKTETKASQEYKRVQCKLWVASPQHELFQQGG